MLFWFLLPTIISFIFDLSCFSCSSDFSSAMWHSSLFLWKPSGIKTYKIFRHIFLQVKLLKSVCLLRSCVSSILSLTRSSKTFFCFECVKDSFSSLYLTSFPPCSSGASNCFLLYFPLFLFAFQMLYRVNLACSIILLWSDGNISSPARYSYLSIWLDNNTDIFYASLLISYCSFSSLISSSIVMINFYILSKRFFPKQLYQ